MDPFHSKWYGISRLRPASTHSSMIRHMSSSFRNCFRCVLFKSKVGKECHYSLRTIKLFKQHNVPLSFLSVAHFDFTPNYSLIKNLPLHYLCEECFFFGLAHCEAVCFWRDNFNFKNCWHFLRINFKTKILYRPIDRMECVCLFFFSGLYFN